MKTDAQLKKDVIAELACDPAIHETAIGVAVNDGVMTLSGHLNTFIEKFAIERAVRRLGGVRAIALEKVRVTVEGGWISLQGEVEWEFQRQAAYKAIRPLVGVVGISNEITLKRKPTPADVAGRIEEALLREAKRVQIDVNGGVVHLRGNVHSWQEREAVAGSAWSVPGVLQVIDDLRVGAW